MQAPGVPGMETPELEMFKESQGARPSLGVTLKSLILVPDIGRQGIRALGTYPNGR